VKGAWLGWGGGLPHAMPRHAGKRGRGCSPSRFICDEAGSALLSAGEKQYNTHTHTQDKEHTRDGVVQ